MYQFIRQKVAFLILIALICMAIAGCSAPSQVGQKTKDIPRKSERIVANQVSETLIPLAAKKNTKKKLSGIKIGIDPGHQKKKNHDKEPNGPGSSVLKSKVSSGTYGRFTSVAEHEVNLAVALKLKKMLEDEGAEVFLTRDKADVDISNRARAEMMNKLKVDLVLRIHCNGNNNPKVQGASILVPTGQYTKKIEKASYEAGETILKEYIRVTKLKSRGVVKRSDQTGFNYSTLPVCTIEMAYMTNEKEDRALATKEFQETCAQGLFEGIVKHFS